METPSIRERLLKMRELLAGSVWSEAEAQRLWEGLWEVCLSMAERLRELEAYQEEMGLYLEAIDEDLAELEAVITGAEDEEEEGEEETLLDLCPRCRRPFSLS